MSDKLSYAEDTYLQKKGISRYVTEAHDAYLLAGEVVRKASRILLYESNYIPHIVRFNQDNYNKCLLNFELRFVELRASIKAAQSSPEDILIYECVVFAFYYLGKDF